MTGVVSHLLLQRGSGRARRVETCVSQIKNLWLRRGLGLSKVTELIGDNAGIRTAVSPVLFLNCLLVSFLLPSPLTDFSRVLVF